MMNVDNDDMDLGLSHGHSSQCIQTRSANNLGAGVNAGSRASDPLSELVWSPHKGLSLKCTDCSLAENRPSFMWGVGPSNMVISPLQSIISRGTNDDKPIDPGNLITPQEAFHVDGEADGTCSARSPRCSAGCVFQSSCVHYTGSGDNMEKGNALVGNKQELNTLDGIALVHNNQEENQKDVEGKGLCCQKNIQVGNMAEACENNPGQENQGKTNFLPLRTNECRPELAINELLSVKIDEEMITDHSGTIADIDSGTKRWGLGVALDSEVHSGKLCDTRDGPVENLPSPGRSHEELALDIEEESKNKVRKHYSTSAIPLEKLEFTAENDFPYLTSNDACGQSEEGFVRDTSAPSEASPANDRTLLYQSKGKEKASSDEDINERMSEDKDDSHESLESCNSAGLFSKGKKRWNYEQNFIVGSKRIKKQIQESPASISLVKQDSSFMNWISNVVKGLAKSNPDKAASHVLTPAHPNHGHGSHDQEINRCNKINDSGGRNMGFQTIFQSLYCPNAKIQETRMLCNDYTAGGSKELVPANKTCANITPVACCGGNDKSLKPFLVANEMFDQSTSGNGGGQSSHPRILSSKIAATQETCKINFAENRTSSNMACSKAKDGASSSESSLSKNKTNSAEKNNSDPPPEGKAIYKIGCQSDPLRSLWIARFSSKTYSPLLNLEHRNQSTHAAFECSTGCRRLTSDIQNRLDFSIDQKSSEARECSAEDEVNVVGKELQNSTIISFGFKRIHGHSHQKSIFNLNPILPFQKFQSSEAMASVFARRLDALKHIIPSNVKNDATRMATTCFFCGRSGHDLRDCSEVTETELEDLVRNINSYDGAEESPCLCIRCFQLGHWAITCPVAPSSRHQQSKLGASFVNRYSASKVLLCADNGRCSSMLETKENHPLVAGEHDTCNGKESQVDSGLHLNRRCSRKMIPDRRILCLDEVQKHVASSSRDDKLKENQITPCNLVSKQISNVPKGMFDGIRKLRLSRRDILKWLNSSTSLSCLAGFFLRLRLGKWEEGLGGTGYHVACISGAQEESPKNSKNRVRVNIGSIKCFVESQYVSNHDFLEEELMAWWCTTSRSGGKVPSEEDLKLKFEERKKLCL